MKMYDEYGNSTEEYTLEEMDSYYDEIYGNECLNCGNPVGHAHNCGDE